MHAYNSCRHQNLSYNTAFWQAFILKFYISRPANTMLASKLSLCPGFALVYIQALPKLGKLTVDFAMTNY